MTSQYQSNHSLNQFMEAALSAAKRTTVRVSPNPHVGAVVVKNGQVIATGWHEGPGSPHAEVMAIRAAGSAAVGSTLYVTLEPCDHFGRTPPCTEAILQAGIHTVHVAMVDPNPVVAGRGISRLRSSGINVFLNDETQKAAEELNRPYITWMQQHRPWITLKVAHSLNGVIPAGSRSCPAYITGSEGLTFVHQLRARRDAILVGVGTVLADDPQLTYRGIPPGADPLRVILDTHGRTLIGSRVCNVNSKAQTWIYTTDQSSAAWRNAMNSRGVRIISSGHDRVHIPTVIDDLADHGIQSVLVEGGPTIYASFIAEELVDEWITLLSPKMLQRYEAASEQPKDLGLAVGTIEQLGRDLLIVARRDPS